MKLKSLGWKTVATIVLSVSEEIALSGLKEDSPNQQMMRTFHRDNKYDKSVEHAVLKSCKISKTKKHTNPSVILQFSS